MWWWIAALAVVMILGIIGGRSSRAEESGRSNRGILWMLFLVPRAVLRGLWRILRWTWALVRRAVPFILRLIGPLLRLLRSALRLVWNILKAGLRWMIRIIRMALATVMRVLRLLWSFLRVGLRWVWKMLRMALMAIWRIIQAFLKMIRPLTRLVAGILRRIAGAALRILKIAAALFMRVVRWAWRMLAAAARWTARMLSLFLRMLRSVRFIRIALDAILRLAIATVRLLARGIMAGVGGLLRILRILLSPVLPLLKAAANTLRPVVRLAGAVPLLARIGAGIAATSAWMIITSARVLGAFLLALQLPVPALVSRRMESQASVVTAGRSAHRTLRNDVLPDVRQVPDRLEILNHLRPIGWMTRTHLSILSLQSA